LLILSIFALNFDSSNNMKRYIALSIIIFHLNVSFCANFAPRRPYFRSPLDIPLVLSGNFGENRSNHFHSGLDLKTQHRTGLPVYAMADGYVSRIHITPGSGYMIDIAYNCGVSSVYRHLEGFVDPIMARTRAEQYKKMSWEVDFTLKPNEFPVKAGQQVAWSGNMGFSAGPHVHLDMYRTACKDYFDPLPLLSQYVKDHKKPLALSLQIFPTEGKGVVNGTARPHIFAFGNTITAWGRIGLAVKAYDYIDETWYCLGVRSVELLQDGNLLFSSDMQQCSQAETRMVSAWMYGNYMKSFLEPGNTLRILKAYNDDRGFVTVNEERDYHFEYILKDIYGNTSHYHFTIHGKKQEIPPAPEHKGMLLSWNRTNYLSQPGVLLTIPSGAMIADRYINFKIGTSASGLSYRYQLNDRPIPLYANAELKIKLRKKPVADLHKYYMVKVTNYGLIPVNNVKVENDYVVSNIKELGTYEVALDNKPPHIMPVNQRSWNRGKLAFAIADGQSGIKYYHGYIDGKFAIFDRTVKNALVKCDVDTTRVQKGQMHTCTMIVQDQCGNVARYSKTFKF
jgi:murein DD-endopeptidase MepM/ murein hydrolase activator NlpD